MDIDEILLDAEDRMEKSVKVFREALAKIRTGKASVGLLDGIVIPLYGSEMPLEQVANLLAPEARLLVIQPYDKNAIPAIEKAILQSNLGLNPVNDGTVVRINIPQLTEERRKEIVKIVHRITEEHRTAVRQVRRDANDHIKKLEKDHEISEDVMHDKLKEVQDLTDKYVALIDEAMADKETEVLEI